MARSTMDDLAYGERWDKDRFMYERDRERRGGGVDRLEERNRYPSRGPGGRPWEDDYHSRERRYDDEPRYRQSPPREERRRVVIDRERERDYRNSSPPARPTFLRRQSSLDTFDRRPPPRFYEKDNYGPPARRDDYRPDPYEPIPLPRSRALPPPRMYAERDYDEIKISEPERYGDDEYHAYPERVREREVTKHKRLRDRSGSRHSKARTHHSSARSSSRTSTTSSSSSSSSSGGTTVTVKSEYPKKGKTRIPGRLVSKRALIDLGYPYVEEGNTVIVQKALGQENIDDLLKLSDEYKKAELEVAAARSSAGQLEERKTEIFTIPPPPPAPLPAPAPAPAPVQAPAPPAEVIQETRIYRDPSPARTSRSYSTSASRTSRSYSTSASARTPLVVEASPREYSHDVALGPLAIVGDRRRDDHEIKMEIARLEAEREYMRRDRHRHHHHHHHSHSPGGELVTAERLPTGELVLYEEQVERVEEPRRGVRIEKDKKGRMSISVPKYR